MTTAFKNHISDVVDTIIAISLQLDNEIETWRDVVARVPDSTSKGTSAGFISKPTANSGIEVVVDVQASPNEQTARLRIWAIETIEDDNGNERFNNIQLTYHLGYDMACKLIGQTNNLTRDDFSMLAHDPVNQLENIVISDLTGKDAASHQLLGKRYDLGSDELSAMNEDVSSELITAIDAVLERLKKSTEIKSHSTML